MFKEFPVGFVPTDLNGWRRAVLSDVSPLFQASWDVCLEVWGTVEEATARRRKAPHLLIHGDTSAWMLEHYPVWPYGGELEKVLGPGVWTDGLHIWVAQSTVAELRRADLAEADAGRDFVPRLRQALLSAAHDLAAAQAGNAQPLQQTPGTAPPRPWPQVRVILERAAPGLVAKLPESERTATERDVRVFQSTVHKPAAADLAALKAWTIEPWATRSPFVDGFPLSATYARRCGWLGDAASDAIERSLPNASSWWTSWMVADHSRHTWDDRGDLRTAQLLASCPDKSSYRDAMVDVFNGYHGYGEMLELSFRSTLSGDTLHKTAPLNPWTLAIAALRDSTPETQEADLDRWYRAFLKASLTQEEQESWSSLAPSFPSWRGAARWWSGRLSDRGLMFLLQQKEKGPVPARILDQAPQKDREATTTPLIRASRWDHTGSTVAALLAAGQNVTATDSVGETALLRARGGGAVERLLEAGSDVAHVNQDGNTALHLVFQTRDLPVVPGEPIPVWKIDQLLAAGARIDARNNEGQTPLHTLIQSSFENNGAHRLHVLMAAGADPFALDNKSKTPLDGAWAASKEKWLAACLSLPALSLAQFSLESARQLKERLLQAPVQASAQHHALLEAWWQPFSAAEEATVMATELPDAPRIPSRSKRM